MGSSRLSLKRSLLFSAAFAVSLLSAGAFAQQNTNTNTNTATSAPTSNRNTQSTSSQRTTAPTQTSSSSSANTRSSSSSPLPTLGTSAQAGPTGLPTLSKTVNTEIPNYPPPTVPPTQNAPFMNHSTLPDGTVFIAVGSILGAFGAAILAWRGIVACLLHRSVERATLAQHAANDKAASFPAPPSQFYKFLERDPSPVGGGGGAGVIAGRIHRKSHRGPTPSATPSQTNLFFSPTAGPGGSTGIASSSNRDSRYLPSGFYASASPMPGHAAGNSISLSTLRPSSRGRVDPSPPHSPIVAPHRSFTASSLSLNRPPSANERAPSAFLDDLLGDQPGAGPYPGQQMNHQSYQQPYGGRFPGGPDGQYYSQSPSPPGHRGY